MSEEPLLGEICLAIVDCEHKTVPVTEDGDAWAVGTPAMADGRIDYSKAKKIDDEVYSKWTRRMVPAEGDLILAREAPVGPVVRVPRSPRVALGQRTVLLRPNPRIVNERYLHFLLLSAEVQNRMHAKSEGSTVRHLNVEDVRTLPVPLLPSISDQVRIAEVLGALDDKIESNRRISAVMDDLSVVEYSASLDVQSIPALEILSPVLGGTPKRSEHEYWSGGVPWVAAKDVTAAGAGLILDTAEEISAQGVAHSAAKVLPAGTTIITARGTVGALARITRPMSFNQSCYGLTPVGDWPPTIVYRAIQVAIGEITQMVHGTVFDTITKETFAGLCVRVPREKVRSEVVRSLESMDSSLISLAKETRSLVRLRDALLPELLSGRLRVKDAEKVVEEAV